MSDILANSQTNYMDNTSMMSQGQYEQMLNQHTQNTQNMNKAHAQQLERDNMTASGYERERYKFLHSIQEYADQIESRYKDKSDANSASSHKGLFDPLLTEAMLRQKNIAIAVSGSKIIFGFAFSFFFAMIIPFFLDKFDMILGAIILLPSYGTVFFFQHILLRSRRFVVGLETKMFFVHLLKIYERVKMAMKIITIIVLFFVFFISAYPGYFFSLDSYMYQKASAMPIDYLFIYVLFMSLLFWFILIIVEREKYNVSKMEAKDRKVAMDQQISTAGDVAIKIQGGIYDSV